MSKVVNRYKITIKDSDKEFKDAKKTLKGFAQALNDYFKDKPWGDFFDFDADDTCFFDKNENYTYEFDLEYDTEVGDQIAEVGKNYYGDSFDYIEPESLTRFCVVLNNTPTFEDSGDQYEAEVYKGKEWGVFAKRSRAWVAFGTKKQMQEKAKNLNKLALEDCDNTKVKDEEYEFLNEYKYNDYSIEIFKGPEDKYYWQASYIGDERRMSNFNVFVEARGIELNLMSEEGYGSKDKAYDKAKKEIDNQKIKWNDSNSKFKDNGLHNIDYIIAKGKRYPTETVGQVEKFLAVNSFSKNTRRILERLTPEEIFDLLRNGTWYENHITKNEFEDNLLYEPVGYETMKGIEDSEGNYDNSIDVVVIKGKEYPTFTVEDIKKLIEENKWSVKTNRILEVLDYEDILDFLRDPVWKETSLTKREFEKELIESGSNTDYDMMDSKKVHDMNAEEIINLINKAGKEGKTWYWLKNKLPEEFLEMYNKEGRVFPIHTNYREQPEKVNLSKVKRLENTINWNWLPEYKELKEELNDVYGKYNASSRDDIREQYRNSDSVSERKRIEKDIDTIYALEAAIKRLFDKADLPDYYGFYPGNYVKPEIDFDKEEYLKGLKKSGLQKEHRRQLRKNLVNTPYKNNITSQDDPIEPLTPEAEDYIRRILGKTDTEEIKAKIKRRTKEKYEGPRDVLKTWENDRYTLRNLIQRVKNLKTKGSLGEMRYEKPRPEVRYREHGGYNSAGQWVGSSGNYTLTGRMTKRKVRLTGVEEEHQKALSEAMVKAFEARTTEELKASLREALMAVNDIPNDNKKIKEAKQEVMSFIRTKRNEMKQRRQNKLTSDGAYEPYIYLFPKDMLDEEDLRQLEHPRYNLKPIGVNRFGAEENLVVRGSKNDLERYAKYYLDYELHPDYLYRENEFAGRIE